MSCWKHWRYDLLRYRRWPHICQWIILNPSKAIWIVDVLVLVLDGSESFGGYYLCFCWRVFPPLQEKGNWRMRCYAILLLRLRTSWPNIWKARCGKGGSVKWSYNCDSWHHTEFQWFRKRKKQKRFWVCRVDWSVPSSLILAHPKTIQQKHNYLR